ncbi:MAG: hypothetical protein UR28_C0017G0011 [Candidatus Peregrinibacteria bacterium GW2011_GWF2_33_10]|nr:MAG: hypothetical protein UR28_C0017G0011 [Candidatus Peregrinibacteria bacterium GW2011_GWF2_33_10]OGJ44565.1 MAG: preprotein translocase subunit SecG [Candidatus Peregrinibacteria bacterium RIFOXYA2_FULL_33_21]OGJ44871.1 MAG: preprotein translocase subunit SecG [Candidatus Peregrinibacteria bacterium RIFOXYA12_FULL_33_12]OGJ50048.1 MAG: preprotein translocase subunit SecG [Candidatus Peregrinibacteria bacterium RIFOXYB2_FULL_33_20]
MHTIVQITQIISAILLVIFILAQQRGSGLGSMAGYGGNQVFTSRRGAEKVIFNITIILTVIFVSSSILIFVL